MSAYQILGEGERYVTDADRADPLWEDPVLIAQSVGLEYRVRITGGMPAIAHMVTYLPSGPGGLREVVVGEGLTWAAAFDLVRERVAGELAEEGVDIDGTAEAPHWDDTWGLV